MNRKVLIIEDDIQMQNLIVEYLSEYNFDVTAFIYPKDLLERLSQRCDFDIVVLDLTLPQIDGFDLFKKIKKICDIPIIISSARGDIGNKIVGFELGADDYLSKPYEPRELVLRIEYILQNITKKELKIGDFIIDEKELTLVVDGYEVYLTKIEFEIFLFLIKNRNKISSREQIVHATNLKNDTKNRTIDMHISNIRYKIGDDPKEQKYIKSIWGIGYKFVG